MKYKLSDDVALRCVQIFQEALLLGVDGAELLRSIVLVPSESEGVLTLDDDYVREVKERHAQLLAEAQNLSTKN